MTRVFLFAATLTLLSACVDAAMVKPTVIGVPPPVPGDNLTSPAAVACRAAIAKQTGRPVSDVDVFDVAESEAGVGVMASVVDAEKPWSCQASPGGRVAGVMYTGSEGAL